MIEGFAANVLESFEESDYVEQLNKGIALANTGKIILAQPYETSTVNYRLLNLASYLLLKGNQSFISMGGSGCKWWPEYEIPIGHPTQTKPNMQGYAKAPHVYMREYSNGLVIVNSDKASAHTVQLSSGLFPATPSAGGGDLPDDTCASPKCGIPSSWAVGYSTAAVTSLSVPAMSGAVLVKLAPEPSPALSCPDKVGGATPGLYCDTRVKGAYVLCPTAERFFCPSGQVCNQTDPAGVVGCTSVASRTGTTPNSIGSIERATSSSDAPATHVECASVPAATPSLICLERDNGGGSAFQVCPNGTQVDCDATLEEAQCWAGAPRRVLCGAAQPSFPLPKLPGIEKEGPKINVSDPRVVLWNGRWAESSLGGEQGMMCGWPGCSVNFTFRGTDIAAVQQSGCGALNVVVDGTFTGYFIEYPQVWRTSDMGARQPLQLTLFAMLRTCRCQCPSSLS